MVLDIPAAQPLTVYSEGTLTATGANQDVVELNTIGTLEGWIDLSNMQAGDTVTISEAAIITSGGSYKIYASQTYNGAQAYPALHPVKLPTKYGLRIRLRQTAGTLRTFDFQFFKGTV